MLPETCGGLREDEVGPHWAGLGRAAAALCAASPWKTTPISKASHVSTTFSFEFMTFITCVLSCAGPATKETKQERAIVTVLTLFA